MPMGSFFASPYLSILQRPTSPCLYKHTVYTTAKKKMVGRWKMKWKHTWIIGGASRLIGWHWQRLGGAWFPVSWFCALSMGLDFGLVCDNNVPHILQIPSAKELKHRQTNWQMLGEGMSFVFGVWVFFFPRRFQKYVTYGPLTSERVAAFQMRFGCHQEGNTEWFLWGAGDWSVQKSQCC